MSYLQALVPVYSVRKFWLLPMLTHFHTWSFWVPILTAGGPYFTKNGSFVKAWGSLLVLEAVRKGCSSHISSQPSSWSPVRSRTAPGSIGWWRPCQWPRSWGSKPSHSTSTLTRSEITRQVSVGQQRSISSLVDEILFIVQGGTWYW